jgi:hypothetical protein
VLDIPASAPDGVIYGVDNSDYNVFPNGAVFQIGTQPARPGDEQTFGGGPFVLVQRIDPSRQDIDPLVIALERTDGTIDVTASAATPAPVSAPSGAVIGGGTLPLATGVVLPTSVPTATPDLVHGDVTAPSASVLPLPVISPPTFIVTWTGQDNGLIAAYLIWVRVDGGDWQPWLETSETQAEYTGAVGSSYEFAAWARDSAGNWSANTDIIPQASTAVRP